MPEIQANFASVLFGEMAKKQWGIVNRKGNKIARNYNRVLKNGKGLSFPEAIYESGLPEASVLRKLIGEK